MVELQAKNSDMNGPETPLTQIAGNVRSPPEWLILEMNCAAIGAKLDWSGS
ncbi:hypothetical protein SAMN04488523_1268 [Sulfitobacter brevis]|uniref:Uncharacterized protein n=1 Tax=Sulfitobacter brevis TaxID=74348 RepID=A0A1I2GK96_9RHOB|nr:hypothetical protein SAMN04488523_1268 [Sulfitobacter brevis]